MLFFLRLFIQPILLSSSRDIGGFFRTIQFCRSTQLASCYPHVTHIRYGIGLARRVELVRQKQISSSFGQCFPYLGGAAVGIERSEEHTSELQSREKLVCRLLL